MKESQPTGPSKQINCETLSRRADPRAPEVIKISTVHLIAVTIDNTNLLCFS